MRKSVVLLVIASMLSVLSAAETGYQELVFTAKIAENYGVNKPIQAVSLDNFVFEIYGQDILLTEEEIDLGTILDEEGSFGFKLLYYGNLANSYDVRVVTNTGSGWFMKDRDGNVHAIPITVEYSEAEDIGEDIIVDSHAVNNGIGVHIPATGPRQGDPVLNVSFDWELGDDVMPGEYQAVIGLSLEAI